MLSLQLFDHDPQSLSQHNGLFQIYDHFPQFVFCIGDDNTRNVALCKINVFQPGFKEAGVFETVVLPVYIGDIAFAEAGLGKV